MLLEAARRTAGVLADPAPRVFQTALSDFYPEYCLVAQAAPTGDAPRRGCSATSTPASRTSSTSTACRSCRPTTWPTRPRKSACPRKMVRPTGAQTGCRLSAGLSSRPRPSRTVAHEPDPERRKNLALREADQAYRIIEPFFDPANAWNGQQLEHLAYRLIRENLPQLPPADVQAIVTAATRIYRSRHPAGQ
jgi:hypothetical protein